MPGYAEQDLVSNRTSLLLFGGAEGDRRAWAEEAAESFWVERPLRTCASAQSLRAELSVERGVLYVPDVIALRLEGQGLLVRCLREQEERPKLVLGVPQAPDEALAQGLLRSDLHYALRLARVDLSDKGLREVLKVRRLAALEARRRAEAAATPRPAQSSRKPLKVAGKKKPAKPARKPMAKARSSARR
jgi:hypothetical protein